MTKTANGERAKLTDRQRAVLDFISNEITNRGYPPTIREIGAHLSMKSTNGVNDHLKALERKGYIARDGQKSRSLRIIDYDTTPTHIVPPVSMDAANDDFVDVPLLGRVAAGAPILAEQDAEDTVRVSSFFLGRGAHSHKIFALEVVGESMIEDGIFDGDFLFVKKQPVARKGEIVVAMIEGEATVKRYFPEGDRIRLQPANSAMEPIYVSKSEFRQTDILGIVVGVYRKF